MALLEVNNVSKVFGGLSAVTNLKMNIEAGERRRQDHHF